LGRFEAAHCAAHLATIFCPRLPRFRLRDVFAMVRPIAGSPEPYPLERKHEAHPLHEIALRRPPISGRPAGTIDCRAPSRRPAAIALGTVGFAGVRRSIALRRATRAVSVSPRLTPGRIGAGKKL